MPELPEVETIRRQLDPVLCDSLIMDAWSFGTAKFESAPLAVGMRLGRVRRRGKYLLIDLSEDREPNRVARPVVSHELIVHLGMTGRLSVVDRCTITDSIDSGVGVRSLGGFSHPRALWCLEDGRTLLFDDVRRFGRVAVVEHGDHGGLPTLAALGPEPFDESFDPEFLRLAINHSNRFVKTQLLSQRVVAGVGNIYADEALWRAGIHPGARRLTRAAATRLRDEIRAVLDQAIQDGGTTLRNYRDADGGSGRHQNRLACYGRYGQPCVTCATMLQRVVLDGRTTSFCPTCQRR